MPGSGLTPEVTPVSGDNGKVMQLPATPAAAPAPVGAACASTPDAGPPPACDVGPDGAEGNKDADGGATAPRAARSSLLT